MKLERLARNYAAFMVRNGAPEEQFNVYAYGMEVFLNHALIYGIIVAAGILLHLWIEALIWIASWTLLRGKAGGSHGQTHLQCLIVSVSIGIGSILLARLFAQAALFWFLPAAICFSVLIVFLVSPVEHPEKPYETKQQYLKTRKLARLYVLVESGVIVLLSLFAPQTFAYITAISMTGVAAMALMGHFTNPREKRP